MSTQLVGAAPEGTPLPLDPKLRVTVITARWNSRITHSLRDAAIATLTGAGVKADHITSIEVPGAIELVNAAAAAIDFSQPGAVIIIGCVIRGDTPHFDYVCSHVTTGAAILNARGRTPVIFGVLTVDTLQQALDRAGEGPSNKGAEAANAAIEMANLHTSLSANA